MDWNWFYSSVAQSVAAIVGIIAAFVITKIISSQTTYARDTIELKNLINDSKRLVEGAGYTGFKSYNGHIRNHQFNKLKDRLMNESSYLTPDQYFSELQFSEFDSKEDIMPTIEKMIQTCKSGSALSLPNYAPPSMRELEQEKQILNSFLADIRQHIGKVSNFLDSIEGNPQSSGLITVAIISTLVLFFVGVIYPLSLLPFDSGNAGASPGIVFLDGLRSPKGVILVLVSIIFMLIMTVFLVVNLALRHKKNELQLIRLFTRLSAYSQYLGYAEVNLLMTSHQTPPKR